MKILILTNDLKLNGISSVIMNYLRFLDKDNFSIDIACGLPVEEKYHKELLDLSCELIQLPRRKKNCIKFILQLIKLIKEKNYDVVHIHGNSGTMAIESTIAKIYKIPKVIAHVHNTTCSHPKLFGPGSLLCKRLIKTTDYRLACSEMAGKWLFRNDYIVLKNGIDIEKFSFNSKYRDEIRAEFGIDEKTFVIGHVGLFNKQKNHEFLLKVFFNYLAINPNSKLMLLGDGENREAIKKLAEELNIIENVLFIGNRADVARYYNAMDIFVFPSLWEGLPVVSIEAQTNGLCVISSNAVTSEAKCTERLFFKDLSDGPESWANEIAKIKLLEFDRSNDVKQSIIEYGYDIKHQANHLREIYLK